MFGGLKNAIHKEVTKVKFEVVEDMERFFLEQIGSNECERGCENERERVRELFAKYRERSFERGCENIEVCELRVKKKLSPYNMFIRDAIQELKKSNPDMKGQELMKRATEAWVAQKNDKTREQE